jgi:hypothetical protein
MENRSLIICVKFLVLFLIALLGWLNLNQIFNGDQALFTIYASEINQGALLYRDVWDIKQPGIFIFYLLGGRLFGFNESGIHLFELIYWLIFSAVLQSTLKNYFRHQLFAQITPLLTAGIYYAVCRSWHLTQVEALVGFPLYLTLWTAFAAYRAESKQKQTGLAFLSGFFGGAVLLFKLAFLPLVLIFWLLLLNRLVRRKKITLRETFGSGAAAILAGAVVLPLAVFIYFARHDALPVVFYTFFQYPSQAIVELTADDRSEILKNGIRWFVLTFKSLLLVLTIGIFLKLKQISVSFHKIAKIDLMSLGFIVWLGVGVGVIMFQRLSWWEYHYLLLLVPLGILGAKSLEIIYERAAESADFLGKGGGKIALFGMVMILFSPHLKQFSRKAGGDFEDYVKTPAGQTIAMPQGDFAAKYLAIRDEVGFLAETGDAPEKIFVVGQPLYYYHSGRRPAIGSNGWMPEFFLDKQWRQLEAELRETKPKYIFIEVNLYEQLAEKSPATIELLKTSYRRRNQNKYAYCYELYSAP